ncbi:M14 family metallocarboxypeptidase [Vibrio sp. ZSDZ34]|uniref:M14 family metallocarboxypeptidase n=1 Tax=Vibrio gelatinilyticus TaxID=2893468 RepID=A0A9X2AVI1_9VIBR|nr:M14 family metallocarboxypeptidase [Vibrio gelatinilyticus]MCJ2376211.1 M14 family metallocarboxypeptidase [Vibrio gelatinilyticus]
MKNNHQYPIGTPGQKWTDVEVAEWRASTQVKRLYGEEVLPKISELSDKFDVVQYGALSYDAARFPLYVLKSKNWNEQKPTVLVTGGVHGYETSGVHGALKFADTQASHYQNDFNLVIAPCISPWGYETINRWNPNAIDPNRSFYADSPSEEAANIMKFVAALNVEIYAHIDLHETTDTDESEFRPALAARDGLEYFEDSVPDGFYTVGNTEKPQPDFQAAVIRSVEKVTHIAPADENNNIIGSPVVQRGVINYPLKKLSLCAGMTDCLYSTTTEVYPDSPKVDAQECNDAQVAAVTGALAFLKAVNR